MVCYENAKIYKLLLPDGYFYIGCTCNELKVRKQAHKNACKSGIKQMRLYKHTRENKQFEWKDIHIVLYEEYPCEIKSELLLRESQIIRQFCKDEFCLNSLTNTQYDGSTKEKQAISHKLYVEVNKEKIKYLNKIYKKEYYEKNKEMINKRNSENYYKKKKEVRKNLELN